MNITADSAARRSAQAVPLAGTGELAAPVTATVSLPAYASSGPSAPYATLSAPLSEPL